MGEYMFGLGRGRVSDATYKAAEDIAKRHDCTLNLYQDPGQGPRYWFAGPNLGEPFDGAMRSAVIADLDAAGLWPLPTD